jgi:peptidoglycan/xylan/chitin deacetylase (PgdA/CDA1 family)
MFDVTLSFDNGPDPEVTPHVLSVLARRRIRASFFVLGEKLMDPQALALVARAHEEGHWLGNHTWSHAAPLGERAEPDVAEIEIGRTQAALAPWAHAHRYFRPNGGGGNLDRRLLSPGVVDYLIAGRYTCVLWNAIPRDWAEPETWVPRALEQCRAQPWTLIVLHDLPTGAMRHLERFLDALGEAGGRVRQDFPPDCMPIVDGVVVRPIDTYMTGWVQSAEA